MVRSFSPDAVVAVIELHSLDGSFGYDGWAGLRNPDIFVLRGAALDSLRFQRLDAP